MVTDGWADGPTLKPGDTFRFEIPEWPKWALRLPLWLRRFVPKKNVFYFGRVPEDQQL